MNDLAPDVSGLMVLRAWIESGDRLRVKLTYTVDVLSDTTARSYAATKEEVLEQVGAWLDSFVTPAG